jgi:hypothetical protein
VTIFVAVIVYRIDASQVISCNSNCKLYEYARDNSGNTQNAQGHPFFYLLNLIIMSKLISNPTECGWRRQSLTRLGLPTGIYVCYHKSRKVKALYCSKPIEFPTTCPLQTGYSIKQIIKDHPLMTERLTKPKRRNRKDCKYIDPANVIFRINRCKVRGADSKEAIGCTGVTCGYFETKTK